MHHSSAMLKTLRQAAGFTVVEACQLTGVSKRTWEYWESPRYTEPIKPDIEAALRRYVEVLDAAVHELDAQLERMPEDAPIVLVRYRAEAVLHTRHPQWGFPFQVFNARIRHLFTTFASERDVVVVWDDDPLAESEWAVH